MRRFLLSIAFLSVCFMGFAYERDSVCTAQDSAVRVSKKQWVVAKVAKTVAKLFDVDTTYIEPQHYNFQAMMQNRYSYEVYRVSDNKGNSVRFEPEPSMKVGPYVGWSLIFLGWSIDVFHLNEGSKRKEFDISLYSLPLGVDFFWRKSGNDYRINNITLDGVESSSPLEGTAFNGFESSVSGLNIYYIFNHRKFSYPAAFNQSTRQKRSCGSPLAGIGYTRHSLNIDWLKLKEFAKDHLNMVPESDFMGGKEKEDITYTDFSLSGGYGYNWVFARNWLFASSLSLALSYKRTIANSLHGFDAFGESINFRDFKIKDITLDGVGRFGVVWYNDKWFVGTSAIVHSFNYSRQQFYTNNIFGMINLYGGFNFGMKKKYKKKQTTE